MARPMDFAERVAVIMSNGLSCRVHCRCDGGFTRLDLHPLPGWVHLADDNTVAKHLAEEDPYHISSSTWPVDAEVWARICGRWHGAEIIIKMHYINDNGGAVLAWEGLGADPDLWQLYMTGSYSYKWHENQYGLHISM